MFKKTLTAVAMMGVFAGSAVAANVTMYGVLDTGLTYEHKDTGVETTDSLSMKTGQAIGTRFGIKGSEQLDNGMTVGFSLENGFKTDTGALNESDKLFDREALVYINGNMGELSFGRTAQASAAFGRYGMFGPRVSVMNLGMSRAIAGHNFVTGATFNRLDNMVTYRSPMMSGFQVTAQYGMGDKEEKDVRENTSATNRTAALGVSYTAGNLHAVFVADTTNEATFKNNAVDHTVNNPQHYSLGAAYDFGDAKAFMTTQYFRDSKLAVSAINPAAAGKDTKHNGAGVTLGMAVPVESGVIKAAVGYMQAEQSAAKDMEIKRYTSSVAYFHNLSKRTSAYVGAGYYTDNYIGMDKDDANVKAVAAGLIHKF